MQVTGASQMRASSLLTQLIGNSTLLVEPDPEMLDARMELLSSANYPVRAMRTPCEVFQAQPESDPNIALLSDALGDFQLNAVAEYVRHRWPRTRILVVGEVPAELEDHLYDEAVPGGVSPREFLATVERCLLE